MGRIDNFRKYADDCVQQAANETSEEDKTLLLNIALAWVRLAQQTSVAAGGAAEPDRNPQTPSIIPQA